MKLILIGQISSHRCTFNGIYDPTDELSGGMPVYAKRGNVEKWIEYWPATKEWMLKTTAGKGTDKGWARLRSDPPAPPEKVVGSVWSVWDGTAWGRIRQK